MVHELHQALELIERKEQDYTAYKFRTKETMAILDYIFDYGIAPSFNQ
ncbi:unnamed protein product [marine sediment metagenome]|uniref:Uncharacterized protein n=1 Tax=marine sediment metagenome TaxID=412755 RepID=X1RQQ6_9ZZZZ